MKKNADIIRQVCTKLVAEGSFSAKTYLRENWQFDKSQKEKINGVLAKALQLEVFQRDHFICQYCGRKTIFIGTLRVLSFLLKDDFPYDSHWQWNKTHPAYYELTASCDHKTPLARGGTNDKSNLATACYRCNARKSNWTAKEFGQRRKSKPNSKWDGLTELFVQLVEQNKIENTDLRGWYRVIKKTM